MGLPPIFSKPREVFNRVCPLFHLSFSFWWRKDSVGLWKQEKINRDFRGIFISPTLQITHLLFVDDVLIFCNGLSGDAEKLREILDLFGKATRMMINDRKSSMSIQNMEEEEIGIYRSFFPFEIREFNASLKYLGFHLKPNSYRKTDWLWMIAKLEK
jgi:hypothetical protein